ncbi:hypothetical protein [Nonomuraea sp. NPDC049695]|uniref:hypothetical protein n=1 Tax=Nonomuraea sp. NPDC049695 TaxID=3154734 RepID=UPI0034182503
MTLVRLFGIPPRELAALGVPAVILSENNIHDMYVDETQIDTHLLDPLAEAICELSSGLALRTEPLDWPWGTTTIRRCSDLLLLPHLVTAQRVASGFVLDVPEHAITRRLAAHLSVLTARSLRFRVPRDWPAASQNALPGKGA